MSTLRSLLYFGVQQLRAGVSVQDVERAERILNGPEDLIMEHVRERLRATHGATAPAGEWLRDQPISDKDALRVQVETEDASRAQWRRTSGSTGEPLVFPKDRTMTAQMDAAMWACYAWHGIRPGMRQMRFWGSSRDWGARFLERATDRIFSRRRLSAFDISPERVAQFYRRMIKFGPRYAYGYPTLMNHFVDQCRGLGLDGRDLGVDVVISTGEILQPSVRDALHDFFDARVVNEYGCTESGILAFECEEGSMHRIPYAAWMEIWEGDDRDQTGRGSVLVTDLFGDAAPLLRYRIGDVARRAPGRCSCGRALPLIEVDVGRSGSFIRTPDGRVVYSGVLAYTVPEGIQRFLVRQESKELLRGFIVPGEKFSAGDGEVCRRRWEEAVGGGVTADVEVVDEIPYSESGKLRYFIPLSDAEEHGTVERH